MQPGFCTNEVLQKTLQDKLLPDLRTHSSTTYHVNPTPSKLTHRRNPHQPLPHFLPLPSQTSAPQASLADTRRRPPTPCPRSSDTHPALHSRFRHHSDTSRNAPSRPSNRMRSRRASRTAAAGSTPSPPGRSPGSRARMRSFSCTAAGRALGKRDVEQQEEEEEDDWEDRATKGHVSFLFAFLHGRASVGDCGRLWASAGGCGRLSVTGGSAVQYRNLLTPPHPEAPTADDPFAIAYCTQGMSSGRAAAVHGSIACCELRNLQTWSGS